MCYSERASWISLTLGTIANLTALAYLFPKAKKKSVIAASAFCLILMWQYALLMQIPDGLAWKDITAGKKPTTGKLAYWLNVLQPVVSLLCLTLTVAYLGHSFARLAITLIAVLAYVLLMSIEHPETSFDISPKTGCSHLDYRWWNSRTTVAYMLAMLGCWYAVPDIKLRLFSIAFFFASFAFQRVLAGKCKSGSLWCFFAAPAGLFTLIAYFLFSR